MTYALGTATGKIELEYDGSAVAKAEQDVEGLKKNTGDAIGGLDKLGGMAGKAGLVIAAGLGAGVAAAANFEQRMSAIGAVSGATGAEFDALRDKALQLGKDTSFSASDAGLAIEELVKAGMTVPDVLNGAADATVALAAAGEIALPEAATIASNAMNQFGVAAEDMPKVADLFAGAANASATGVSEIGQALQQVGAVANLAGVSLEDTTTAIALMANAGINGSDAGTSLKSMFSRLNPTTKAAKDAMKDLGLYTKESGSAFYDQQGNLKDMSQISGLLNTSLKGLTKEQQQMALQTIFGSDAIRAAAILANNGSKGFDKLSKSMGKTTAADVAAKRLDNFKGRLEAMKGSLETAGIAIGSIILPALQRLVEYLTAALNWFLGLDQGTQQLIVTIIAAVGALLLIVAGIAKLIMFVNNVRVALVALRGTMIATWLAALGPIALVIAVIAAVIAIIVLLWMKCDWFRNGVIAVWQAVSSAAKKAWDAIKNGIEAALDKAWSFISSMKDKITGFFSDAGTWLLDAGRQIIQGLIDGIDEMFDALGDKASAIGDTIGRFLPGSPVKEGPLKVLNQGYAGKQIVGMLADGISSATWGLQQQAGQVAGIVANTGVSPTAYAGVRKGNSGSAKPSGLRLIEGKLTIDGSGRAFIRGLAEEVVDDTMYYQRSKGRMG